MRTAIILGVTVAALLSGCDSVCENEILQTIGSPSGAKKAIVFSRNCGATSGFNTQVSVLPAGDSLTDESGNAFVAAATLPVEVKWISDSSLQIAKIGDASPIKQNSQVLNVAVSYAK